MEQEVHIAGIVVFVHPEHLASVTAALHAIPCATVHASSPDGKLIVTLETESTMRTLDYMDAMRALPGVADAALVYQHAETLGEMEQEIET
ncbi:MAG TPA: chaperone NapD [Noviherbaspirillum sp.]|nr:chaperone NapD [Noviherbaspirillum sp.]